MAFQSAFPSRGRGRGGFAPRRGRGGLGPHFPKRNEVKPDVEKHPLGELLATFKNSDLENTTQTPLVYATIRDCNYVASYNWLDAKIPTIMVPGKPPMWTPLKQPQRLKEDSGQYFRDPNAARFPAYPTEPAAQAILKTNTQLSTSDIDVFACGSTMGNLLRFVRRIDRSFRFNVELIGSTVFFVRKENDPKEIIDGVRGYGHTFPEAYTTWDSDVKGSETHQRIVQYDFGSFKCMVRFECDGYLSDARTNKESTTLKSTQGSNVDDLLTAFDDTKIHPNMSSADCVLTINSGGSPVSQHAIFDLKTRSGRYKTDINMDDIYPLLWLKQIPNFIVAYHDGAGLFQDIRVKDVRKDVRAWENQKDNKLAIQRLVVLLGMIIEVAKRNRPRLMEVYCPSLDCIEIRKQYGEGSHALPPSLMAEWAGVERNSLDTANPNEAYESDLDGGCDLHQRYGSFDDDSDDDGQDFTACSADTCGYCGRCTY